MKKIFLFMLLFSIKTWSQECQPTEDIAICLALEQHTTTDATLVLNCGRIDATNNLQIDKLVGPVEVYSGRSIKMVEGFKVRCQGYGCFRVGQILTAGTALTPVLIEETHPIDRFDNITLTPDEIFNDNAIYKWYDEDNNLVYAGKDYEIANATAQKYKLEVLSPTNEIISLKEVELKYKPNHLETLYPNPATTGNLNITYKINEASSAYIMIYSYYMTGGISNNYMVDINVNEKNIDISSLPFGLYKVALVTDGQIVDVKILSKI